MTYNNTCIYNLNRSSAGNGLKTVRKRLNGSIKPRKRRARVLNIRFFSRRRLPQENRVRVLGVHSCLGRSVRVRHRRGDPDGVPTTASRLHEQLQSHTLGLWVRHVGRTVRRRACPHVVRDDQATGVSARVATVPSKPPRNYAIGSHISCRCSRCCCRCCSQRTLSKVYQTLQ